MGGSSFEVVSSGEWEDRLIERSSCGKVSEGVWKVVNRLIELISYSKVGESAREFVN